MPAQCALATGQAARSVRISEMRAAIICRKVAELSVKVTERRLALEHILGPS